VTDVIQTINSIELFYLSYVIIFAFHKEKIRFDPNPMKKKMFLFTLLLLVVVATFFFFFNMKNENVKTIAYKTHPNGEMLCKDYPSTHDNGQKISHKGFTLQYNEPCEQAEWVMYVLTRRMVREGHIKRHDHFREDPDISSGSSVPGDYQKSGYDKGHLCPAADMEWSEQTMDETFYMSNMSPQKPAFNRGIWKKLEEQVREWAVENDSLVVITGPVLTGHLKTIGKKNKVSVPLLYYKVVADISYPTYKIIAFVMKNENSDHSIYDYAVSADSVEKLTGIKFFPDVKEIEQIETKYDINLWRMN
jgi:endonuclease G, mitochondrial